MSKNNVERAREVRLWLQMIGKGIAGLWFVDYALNEGKYTKKMINDTKEKVNKIKNLKTELAKKHDKVDPYDALNEGL